MENENGVEEVRNKREARKVMLKMIALNPTFLSDPTRIVSIISLYDKGYIHIFRDGSISLREDKKIEINKILGKEKDGG